MTKKDKTADELLDELIVDFVIDTEKIKFRHSWGYTVHELRDFLREVTPQIEKLYEKIVKHKGKVGISYNVFDKIRDLHFIFKGLVDETKELV